MTFLITLMRVFSQHARSSAVPGIRPPPSAMQLEAPAPRGAARGRGAAGGARVATCSFIERGVFVSQRLLLRLVLRVRVEYATLVSGI